MYIYIYIYIYLANASVRILNFAGPTPPALNINFAGPKTWEVKTDAAIWKSERATSKSIAVG